MEEQLKQLYIVIARLNGTMMRIENLLKTNNEKLDNLILELQHAANRKG